MEGIVGNNLDFSGMFSFRLTSKRLLNSSYLSYEFRTRKIHLYFLGIDIGSSSIKIALVDSKSGKSLGVVQEPELEMPINAVHRGWAEQNPGVWWKHICNGIKKVTAKHKIPSNQIVGLGISYQMHGLVLVDDKGNLLRDAIIWCDGRAVEIGNTAYKDLGVDFCNHQLLNSPANFTASKLKWVIQNEQDVFAKVYKFMLPGDYIAYRLSDKINTTISGLSEGIFWNFQNDQISEQLLDYYGIALDLIPERVETFSEQARVSKKGAKETGLLAGTPILYRAGDQPNNALSLNVLNPGEVAATGGTSGVMYAVTDNLFAKECARVNNFAHVNYSKEVNRRIGKLLCISGAGIQYRWLLNNLSVSSYEEMNQLASEIQIGADGLCILSFGNGAERMLLNQMIGTRILNLDLNRHNKAHLCRAALEGIAFSFVYGFEIMRKDGIEPIVIKAGNDNLFRSDIFSNTIAALIQKEIEIYDTTGAIGAARACILKDGDYEKFSDFVANDYIETFFPSENTEEYEKAYRNWKKELELILKSKV